MRGNSFGKMFSFVTFGESHGPAYGVVVDGVPSGLDFSLEALQKELDRRAPGKLKGATARQEADKAEVLSGVFEDKTLGTPIGVLVRNTNQRSGDYEKLKEQYRPGHADKTTMLKYGIRDHRGGGRASGRETLTRVIAGYFASLVIPQVKVRAYITKLGPFEWKQKELANLDQDLGPYSFPDVHKTEEIEQFLIELKKKGESVGGRVAIAVDQCPAGLGEPAFDKLKADFAKAFLSIGACTSFSYGLGEEFADLYGTVATSDTKNFGGLEGGITNGDRLFMQLTFRATSTVGENAKEGRHDPCIIPRAIPVVEAMAKVVIADHFLRQQAYGQK